MCENEKETGLMNRQTDKYREIKKKRDRKRWGNENERQKKQEKR